MGSEDVEHRRRYDAPRRRAKADATRRSVLDAARRLFVDKGIVGTTVGSVAAEAGVSVQTVYAVFGSKAGILIALLDDLEVAANAAGYAEAIEASSDSRERLAVIVAFHCQLFASGLDVILVAHRSSSDPRVRPFVEEGETRRRAACEGWVGGFLSRGDLRPGLDAATAVDLLWVHCGPDVYSAFVVGCGWSRERVERWLTERLTGLLFGGHLETGAEGPTAGTQS
jgi:AcrR family transcriptional regulator